MPLNRCLKHDVRMIPEEYPNVGFIEYECPTCTMEREAEEDGKERDI